MDILTIVNLVLTLLDKFVSWGQRNKVFKEGESIIALTLIRNANRDLEIAKKAEQSILNSTPDAVDDLLRNDEFTRN